MGVVFLCGMPKEKEVIQGCFPGFLVLSGTDKLNLPALVPDNAKRIVVSGLFGGLAPGIPVGGICAASSIVDQAGDVFACDQEWNSRVLHAGKAAGYQFGVVPWYSSGVLDQADTRGQRAAIFKKYGAHAIDDEAQFAVAEARRRGIPCNDLRSCSDDWTETLPLAARGPIMNCDGSPNVGYLLSELFVHGTLSDDIDLIKLGMDFGKSLDTLETALTVAKEAVLS